MRVLLLLLSIAVLGGCQKDFDARYEETERRVKAAEAKLDAEMAKEAKREPGERVKLEQ